MYRVWGSRHNWWFPRHAHQEQRAAYRQNNTSVPGGITECSSVSEIRTYCYQQLAAVIPVDINFHSLSILCSNIISYDLLGSNIVFTKLHGITYQIMNVYLTTLRTINHSLFVLKTFRSDKVLCVFLSELLATPTVTALHQLLSQVLCVQ